MLTFERKLEIARHFGRRGAEFTKLCMVSGPEPAYVTDELVGLGILEWLKATPIEDITDEDIDLACEFTRDHETAEMMGLRPMGIPVGLRFETANGILAMCEAWLDKMAADDIAEAVMAVMADFARPVWPVPCPSWSPWTNRWAVAA